MVTIAEDIHGEIDLNEIENLPLVKLEMFTIKEFSLFDFKFISSAMVTNNNRNIKIQCRMVIPWVLDGCLFLNLSQHGLQIASDIWLIIKE